ncbi:MAG: hypothetical protein A2W28_10425 [Gammaproteobacteria bacterium RBG_16_51_14]|nr:MAG: hypothetical protein A2W28_10425 [Gammaproteobacteria bacterium RBG_16_51_14]
MGRPDIQKGFTLIELAIVLFIAGLILVGVLTPLATQIEQKERQNTQDVLNDIEEALYGFTVANGRLPCPDCRDNTGTCAGVAANEINDGQADEINAPLECATAEGNLPWVDLAVPEFDIWGRHYIYRVDKDFADATDGTGCGTATVGVSFELCSDGNLEIKDRGDAPSLCPTTAPGGNTVADNVPAAVISQGKKQDTEQPVSCYEQENTNGDNILVSRDYSQHQGADPTDPTANYYFDDLLIWISPNILKNRMVVTGKLP